MYKLILTTLLFFFITTSSYAYLGPGVGGGVIAAGGDRSMVVAALLSVRARRCPLGVLVLFVMVDAAVGSLRVTLRLRVAL